MSENPPHALPVTVAVDWRTFHGRLIVMGVMRYATEMADRWSLDLFAEPQYLAGSVRRHGSVGVIANVQNGSTLRRLLRDRVSAAVAVLDAPAWNGVVANIDEQAVGRLAAEYLLNQGHRRLAVFEQDWPFARRRAEAFRQRLAEAGVEVHKLKAAPLGKDSHRKDRMYTAGADQLARELKRLPRPLGVFCPSDIFSIGLVRSCREAGMSIPEDVAILGVDNDPMQCLMGRPLLSSIALPFEQVGYLAAQALDQRMMGREVGPLPGVQPTGVVERQSTSLLAVEDPDVATALRFVREHAATGITPGDVLDAVPVSRRSLERRFRATLGRTVMAEIHRVRVERAKELLDSGDLQTNLIAERCGFLNASRLAIVFRRMTGLTPSGYRKRFVGPSV